MPQQKWLQSAEAEAHHAQEAVVPTGAEAEEQLHQSEVQAKNTQTCRQGSGKGAPCTEDGGGGLISVQSPPPVRGKTFSHPNLPTNETGTSPE